ncbi:hypothetical protein KRX52_10715 [Pseudomonas sp. MAP12]|uniref:Uncharacterized protein n=1 Tax=Geopseudomonas aromaticivorans TaxID=2849492 RepID=A0ABS6MWU1_9GAMM|nr:hypothetical protein [Pseudomonas aromaticivorans]MBV2133269.1 hypothetical protein [Pseudomonas aromaticivorans]
MADIDDKVYQYTLNFSHEAGLETDPVALKDGVLRHMASARTVVTTATLERIGHVHLSLMINTAARYGLSLGEVVIEAVRNGSQPVAALCSAISSRKNGVRRPKQKPTLRLV